MIDGAVLTNDRAEVRVNNAPVVDDFAGCLETTDALWTKVVDIDLRGRFFGCRAAALRHMVPAGRGKFNDVSSIGGFRGSADRTCCTASKFEIVGPIKRPVNRSAV